MKTKEIIELDFLGIIQNEPIIRRRINSKLILDSEIKDMYKYIVSVYDNLENYLLNEYIEDISIKNKIVNYLLKNKLENKLEYKNDKHKNDRRKI